MLVYSKHGLQGCAEVSCVMMCQLYNFDLCRQERILREKHNAIGVKLQGPGIESQDFWCAQGLRKTALAQIKFEFLRPGRIRAYPL